MVDEASQERTVRTAMVHTDLVRKEELVQDFIYDFQN
jgi:hypothetical protein